FFSSRRRHTRSKRDWSSDVCSSDLGYVQAAPGDDVAFTHFSLDMTYFEARGHHYMVWAEKPGSSNLGIAEVDPDDPTQLTSDSEIGRASCRERVQMSCIERQRSINE